MTRDRAGAALLLLGVFLMAFAAALLGYHLGRAQVAAADLVWLAGCKRYGSPL